MEMTAIRFERADGVAVITFARPERGNSIDADFFREAMAALDMAAADPLIRVVLTCAEGANFCVGADAGNLGTYAARSIDQIYAEDFRGQIGIEAQDDGELGTGIWARHVFAFPKPLISAVNGVAAGGGMSLALLHHIRICGSSARFTTAFSKLGIGPELGMSVTLPALVGAQNACDLLLSSRLIGAEEARVLGLVLRIEDDVYLHDAALAYAKQLATAPPLALASIVQGQRRALLPEFSAALKWEWTEQRRLFESDDFRESVQAYLEKHDPIFRGR